MKSAANQLDRRNFLKTSVAVTGLTFMPPISFSPPAVAEDNINIIGPKKGFSPQIGTLVSMMDWMRMVVLMPVQGMKREELDYLHDPKANTIGGMLMHLAATETFYQIHTFEGKKWGEWDEKIKQQWDVASQLGDQARKTIKGKDIDYYLNILKETREKTLAELRKRDDKWLMAVDKEWPWGPTNNYCKWFHVCEHESNHNGQIKWLKSRLPGAKSIND
jgi:hypothetical protein